MVCSSNQDQPSCTKLTNINFIHSKTDICFCLITCPSSESLWRLRAQPLCPVLRPSLPSVLSTATVTASGRNYEQIKKGNTPYDRMGMGYTRKNSRITFVLWYFFLFPLQRKFKLVQNNFAIVKGFTFKE